MSNGRQAGDLLASIAPTNNPQVASFTIAIPADTQVTVEFGPDTNYGRSTSAVPAPPGGGQITILVAGMLAGTTYHMRARIQYRDGRWLTTADQTFTTGALPAGILPALTATTAPGQNPSPGVELVNVIDPIGVSVVSDLAGNIIWYYNNVADKSWEGYAFPIRPLKNGNLLASITNLYSAGVPKDKPYNSVLREIDLAGNPIRERSLADLKTALSTMKTPQGSIVDPLCYSHDVLPLWNGHTILLVQERRRVTLTLPPGPGEFNILGDALVDLDENFNPVWVWSIFDNLDPDRHPYEFDKVPDDWDWTHCNCVQLAPDGNLVLSTRNQNWILKINYQGGSGDGTILWKLGYQGDFTLTGDFTADTDWFFAQHFPHILGATDTQITSLSVMDNGNDRCFAMPGGCTASNPAPPPPFTRGAIFTIDETAKTASLAWQYLVTLFGQSNVKAYSFWGGNVMELQNGNIEICASEPVKVGTPPPQKDAPSQVIELTGSPASPQTVWQMQVTTGGTYRSYRIPSLYPGVIWTK
jgi:hypothetical protein